MSFSVVIICRDEEKYIGRCIDSVIGLSDDIIIIDTGSVDATVDIVKSYPVKLQQIDWMGYGATKNYGTSLAKYDWILSIDADEIVSEELHHSILSKALQTGHIYGLRRVNYVADRAMNYSHLKPEIKPRLFHKEAYQWDTQPVHERLTPSVTKSKTTILKGDLLHFYICDLGELQEKYDHYAKLSVKQSSSSILGPTYYFIKSYILQLGILEGNIGLRLALLFSQYKKLKNNQ